MTRRLRPRALALALCASALSAPVACGIPRDEQPQLITKDALPSALVEDATTTTEPKPATRTREATLYLVRERADQSDPEALEPVSVLVPVPADINQFPRAVLDQLMRGATSDQLARGLRSDIPATARVLDARADDPASVLVVNLADLGKVEGPKQRVAVAQIVFTATSLEGITSVRFLVDGQPTAIPIDQGSAGAGDAITRDDFPRFKRALADSGTSTTRSSTTTSASTTTSPAPSTTTTTSRSSSTSTTKLAGTSSTTSTSTPGSTPPSSAQPTENEP